MADACARVNVLGTLTVLRSLEGVTPAAFVLASTTEVYGSGPVPFDEAQPEHPPSPYAISTLAAEQLARMRYRSAGLPAVVLRVATVYGPCQGVHRLIPSIISAYARGEPPRLGDAEYSRDFVFVDDVVDGMLAAASEGARGEVINLGDVTTHTVRDVAETIRTLMGADVTPRYGSHESRRNEARVWASSRQKAERLLGWRPRTSLSAGLERTIEAFQPGRDR